MNLIVCKTGEIGAKIENGDERRKKKTGQQELGQSFQVHESCTANGPVRDDRTMTSERTTRSFLGRVTAHDSCAVVSSRWPRNPDMTRGILQHTSRVGVWLVKNQITSRRPPMSINTHPFNLWSGRHEISAAHIPFLPFHTIIFIHFSSIHPHLISFIKSTIQVIKEAMESEITRRRRRSPLKHFKGGI